MVLGITFIGFALVVVLVGLTLNKCEEVKDLERVRNNYEDELQSKEKSLESLAERYKELMTDEVYWFSKYKLATEKKISRAKFTGTNKDYTKYCKSFEEEIKSYKETITKYEEDHKKVTWSFRYSTIEPKLELSGTELQKERFECKFKNSTKSLSVEEIEKLAVGCGLSVRGEKNMKNILDKNYFDRLRGGILSDEDVQLLLEVIGPMLIETDYVIVKRESPKNK